MAKILALLLIALLPLTSQLNSVYAQSNKADVIVAPILNGDKPHGSLPKEFMPPFQLQTKRPDFDKDVLEPLHKAQAEAAAKAKAQAKADCESHSGAFRDDGTCDMPPSTPQPTIVAYTALGGGWAQLRECEAGGDYAKNTGNGYYGAYQYDIGTWGNYGGYTRPDLAPPSVQDAKAQETFAQRGASPWPNCGRFLSMSANPRGFA